MKSFITMALLFLFALPALPQVPNEVIAAYNQALRGGDRGAMEDAASALAAAAIEHPADPSAGLMAFEAAWALCRLGSCETGASAAEFSLNQAQATGEGPSLQTRNLLLKYSLWKKRDTRQSRAALDEALQGLPLGDVSPVSVFAYRDYYSHQSRAEKWRDAERISLAAAEHMQGFEAELLEEIVFAELVGIAAGVNQDQTLDQLERIISLRNRIGAARRDFQERDADVPDALVQLDYQAQAWEGAIGAVLRTRGEKDAVDEVLGRRSAGLPGADNWDDGLCKGTFSFEPKLEYPRRAARRGEVGSIIVGLSLVEGVPKDVKILAAVPAGVFEQSVVDILEKWRWIPNEDADLTSCSLSRDDIVFPFVFSLDP